MTTQHLSNLNITKLKFFMVTFQMLGLCFVSVQKNTQSISHLSLLVLPETGVDPFVSFRWDWRTFFITHTGRG